MLDPVTIMRVLTHNMIKSPLKAAVVGGPLELEVGVMRVVESQMNAEFVRATLPTLDWSGLLMAARAVGLTDLPQQFDIALLSNETFLQSMHTLLLDIHIESGMLVCTESGKRFPIVNGVPNMLCDEAEV